MPTALVFDDTAVEALGRGNRLACWIVERAFTFPGRRVLVPALCLLAADTRQRGLAEHVGALGVLTVVDLDYPAVVAAAALLSDGMEWRHAHAVHLARPTPDYPSGIPLATTRPALYRKARVPVVELG
ncbi:PIN domain-containing protein [Streptomyces capparidis]